MSKRPKKRKKAIKETEIVLMDVPWDCHYGRQVCRGVHRYARAHRPWVFINTRPYKWLGHVNTVGIISMRHPKDYIPRARSHGLPAVGVGRWAATDDFTDLPYADVDPGALGEMAAEYLLNRGFGSFGMIDADRTFPSWYRGQAFVAAVRRRGLTCETFDKQKSYPPFSEPLPKISHFAERACRWLASLPKPLTVFCINDAMGVWVCDLCRRIKVHVPEEVAVLGADDDDLFCGMANPHLSSVQVPSEQIGYEAAKLLDDMISGQRAPKRPVLLLSAGVITRQSTDVMAVEDRRIAEAMRFIRENACRGIRVEEVIKAVLLPRRTLEKRFRKHLNRSPFSEIRRVQIERVKMLLAQTDMTLEAMVTECGFDSVTRMNMSFKQAVNMPPGAYRRKFRSR